MHMKNAVYDAIITEPVEIFGINLPFFLITTHPTHQSSLGEHEETVPSIKYVKTMCK